MTSPYLHTSYVGNPHDAPIWEEISDELYVARIKFPQPDGLLAALMEEVGELAKAIMDEPATNVRAEAIQVAAVAIRLAEEGDPTLDNLRTHRGLARLSEETPRTTPDPDQNVWNALDYMK